MLKELLVFAILGANLLQASYALQYPPTPHPPLSAGTPRKPVPQSPAGSPRRFKGFTPTVRLCHTTIINILTLW